MSWSNSCSSLYCICLWGTCTYSSAKEHYQALVWLGSFLEILASFQKDLSYNKDLIEMLPQSIGQFKKLSTLILGGCSFNGPIPESIGNLQELLFFAIINYRKKKLAVSAGRREILEPSCTTIKYSTKLKQDITYPSTRIEKFQNEWCAYLYYKFMSKKITN